LMTARKGHVAGPRVTDSLGSANEQHLAVATSEPAGAQNGCDCGPALGRERRHLHHSVQSTRTRQGVGEYWGGLYKRLPARELRADTVQVVSARHNPYRVAPRGACVN